MNLIDCLDRNDDIQETPALSTSNLLNDDRWGRIEVVAPDVGYINTLTASVVGTIDYNLPDEMMERIVNTVIERLMERNLFVLRGE